MLAALAVVIPLGLGGAVSPVMLTEHAAGRRLDGACLGQRASQRELGYAGGPGRPSNWIAAKASSNPPAAIRPMRAWRIRKWPLIPTRNSTVARNTVARM